MATVTKSESAVNNARRMGIAVSTESKGPAGSNSRGGREFEFSLGILCVCAGWLIEHLLSTATIFSSSSIFSHLCNYHPDSNSQPPTTNESPS